ncbi:MAG: hypothetical protein J6J55_00090, partial [Paludibacteraceae bacterium]|nr:hypothetical protein [Paludibacteraceae bacterium]
MKVLSKILLTSIALLWTTECVVANDWKSVPLERSITSVQPMTGLVLWRTHGQVDKYAPVTTLEFSYCLPCKVVKGKKDGKIQYDWSYLEDI